MQPSFIRSTRDFREVVSVGGVDASAETDVLEFKADLRMLKGKVDRLELARDVVQFANVHGGCLIFGVKEKKEPETGRVVASSVCGVSDADRVRESVVDAINRHAVP